MRKFPWMPLIAIVLAAGILLGTYNGLGTLRFDNAAREREQKFQALLPGSLAFYEEPYDGEDANIRAVYKGETGYVVKTVTYGYAGNITMFIGVSNEGRVTGLQIRDMNETPGLGREALNDWEFLAQFLNTTGDAAVGENIDAITGATVTSKAVTRSVNSAVAFVTGADASSGATTWGG